MHANDYSPPTFNAITWLCGEAPSLGSHSVTPTQKPERASLSIEILLQLRSVQHHGWQFIITLDEPWFYLSTYHGQIWIRVEESPLRNRGMPIQNPKMMVTIAWNPLEFHLLVALPKGNTFNAEYYGVNILTELLLLGPQVDARRFIIHADNARLHTA
jgi:hypothetical protein